MARLFKLSSHDAESKHPLVPDLDKVVLARFRKQEGHHYQHIVARFVYGHEDKEMVRPGDPRRVLEAYSRHLSGTPAGPK